MYLNIPLISMSHLHAQHSEDKESPITENTSMDDVNSAGNETDQMSKRKHRPRARGRAKRRADVGKENDAPLSATENDGDKTVSTTAKAHPPRAIGGHVRRANNKKRGSRRYSERNNNVWNYTLTLNHHIAVLFLIARTDRRFRSRVRWTIGNCLTH